MSFPKRTAVLSVAAQADLSDILLYTEQQWGPAQRKRYGSTLQRAITTLASYPEVGTSWPRLFPDCRMRQVGHHILFYRVSGEIVEVVRILHERSDPTRHFRK
jgi:toxin ParE1/3/4